MAKKRAMLIKRGDSTFDRIVAHHKDPEMFPLSEKEEDILKRWREIFALLLSGNTKMDIITMWEGRGISTSQAYADIRNMELIFGDVLKANKEFERVLYLAGLNDYLKRCIAKKDLKAEGKARELIGKYGDVAAEADAQFNPAKLANPEIQFDLPKQYMDYLEKIAGQGVQDFNNLKIVDVDYEDIEPDAAPQ